jgi:hypothetical protein
MHRHSRLWAILLALTAASVVTGCAAYRKEALRKEGAGAYVYPRPISKLWPEVEQFVRDQGYSFRPAKNHTFVTDPKETSAGSGQWVTLLVQAKALAEERTIVRIFKSTRGGAGLGGAKPGDVNTNAAVTGKQTEQQVTNPGANVGAPAAATTGLSRDTELEWAMLQKLDPQGAEQIIAEADRIVEGKSGGMDVAQQQREHEQAVAGTQSASSGGPVSLEDALEAELAKKRLAPGVWIPAWSGAALMGAGVGFQISARWHEGRLIDGDPTLKTDAQVQQVMAAGRRADVIGVTLLAVGATSLATAMVLHYTGIVKRPAARIAVVPTSGGAAAVVGGSF